MGRRTVLTGSLGAGVLGLAGCSGVTEGGAPAASSSPDGPAEPATAPSPTTSPAGTVVAVGYAPEGIVHDPVSGLVAVGVRRPDRLLLLDARTLEVRRSVDVPGTVRHLGLAAGGGTVLVPNEAAESLVEVDTRTGRTRSTPVGRGPHDATGVEGGDVVVADEFAGSLSIVRDGRVVRTVGGLRQPGGVAATGSVVVAVDVADHTVSAYDLSGRRLGRLPGGDGPTHAVTVGDGRVVVSDTRGGRLLLFSADPLRQVAVLDVGPSPYGLAAADGVVWTTLSGSNTVVGVDVAGDRLEVVERLPTVQQPNTVATDGGTLWVASRTNGVVQRIPLP